MRKYEKKMQELGLKKVSAKIQNTINELVEGEKSLEEMRKHQDDEGVKKDIEKFEQILNDLDDEICKNINTYVNQLEKLKVMWEAKNRNKKKQTEEDEEAKRKEEEAKKQAEEIGKTETVRQLLGQLETIRNRRLYVTSNSKYRLKN